MHTEQDILARIRAAATTPDPGLLTALAGLTTPAALRDAGRLLAKLPTAAIASLRPLKVAVAATFTAEYVAPMLRVELLRGGIAPDISVSGFDQLMVELIDPDSDLARFTPDVTLCLLHDQWLLPREWDPTDLPALAGQVMSRLAGLERAVAGFTARHSGTVVLHTVPLARTEQLKVIGFAGRAELGRLWREVNSRLLGLAAEYPQVQVLDIETQLIDRDDRLFQFAGMAWTPAVELDYAREAAAFCRAATGLARKLLVVDLDNTLWGGVLGDDGPQGIQVGGRYPGNCYTDLQRALVALRTQGVLLAVCSKNDAAVVDDVLDTHPELVVGKDDFVARVANWGRKDHNIRQIVTTLNLGLDSVVFVDDSPFECDLVRQNIPQAQVVHLTGDPAGFLAAVLAPQFFGTLATTATDKDRTAMYRARADREEFAASFVSTSDYLSGLGLRVTVAPADEFSLPRIVQLGLRTNQFNLNPRAHTEGMTRELAQSPDHLVLGFEVEDRFGREGLVGAAWIAQHPDHWLVENFVMSCRVFSRGVEHAVLAHIIEHAKAAGAAELRATYHPGDRNKAAAGLIADFTPTHGDPAATHHLDLTTTTPAAPTWITLTHKEPAHA